MYIYVESKVHGHLLLLMDLLKSSDNQLRSKEVSNFGGELLFFLMQTWHFYLVLDIYSDLKISTEASILTRQIREEYSFFF